MNKRITSLMLVFVIALSMLVTAVPVFAEGTSTCTYTVEADKTTANLGDTIKFTIYMQQTGTQNTLEGTLSIPEGLTYVAGSGTIVDGVSATLNWAQAMEGVAWTESSMIFNGFGSISYTGTAKLALMTFECTVDDDAALKDYKVDIIDLVADDEEYETKNPVVVPATVTVTAKPVAVTGVTLNKNTLTLTAGSNETLIATVEPSDATNKSVSWTSSDSSVATVSDGKVTALKKGTATITVKTTDGNKTATCSVTVNCAHTNTTPYSAVPSTCKVQGHDAYTKCDDCGEIISGSDAKLPLADHTYGEWIPEAPATHDANGVKGHYHCSVCEKNFDSGKNELASLVITKDANHGTPASAWKSDATYHWNECVVVGCGVVIDSTKATHTFEWKTDTPATEDTTGVKHEECTVCGYKRNEGTSIEKLDHTHTGIVHHNAVPATCKATGNIEYWTCSSSKCAGKYYSDSACQNEITTGITIPKNSNHTGGTEYRNSKPATCYEDGYEGDIYCLGCGQKIGEGNSITKLSHTPGSWETDATYHWKECTVVACGVVIDSTKEMHTFEWKIDKAATEDETGLKHEECKICGYKRNEGTTIDKLDHVHTPVHHNAVTATCKATGNIEYWTCSSPKCDGKYYSDSACQNEITTGISTPKNDNHVGGTEYRNSKPATCYEEGYEGDIYCLGCGQKIGEGNSITKLSHTPGSWETDATYHWKECTVVACGVVIDDTKAAHTFEWKTDKAATEEETGLKHEECSVCGFKRSENTVIDKLDHTHSLTHTAAVPATCKDTGNVEYWFCEKCEKYFSDAEAANEITEAQTVTAKDTSIHVGGTEIKDAKEATCTEEGYTGDTYCKSCEVKLSDGTKIAAKGHSFKDGKCTVCGVDDPDYKPTDSENPKTGDNSLLYVWLMLLTLSGFGLTALSFKLRNKAE